MHINKARTALRSRMAARSRPISQPSAFTSFRGLASVLVTAITVILLLRLDILTSYTRSSANALLHYVTSLTVPSNMTHTTSAVGEVGGVTGGGKVQKLADLPYVMGQRGYHFKDADGGSIEAVEKIEYFIPQGAVRGNVQGVVLLAHGCKVKASVWWPRDAQSCPDCQGMPVEREIIRHLVHRGYVPVTLSPWVNRKGSQCWADSDKNVALDVVSRVYHSLNLSNTTPFYALGIANGAIFVERMACSSLLSRGGRNISAIVMMNGGIWHNVDDKTYPPVLFLCMARNSDLCLHNNQTMTKLQARGALVKQVVFEPRPVLPSFFHTVGNVLSLPESERLHAAFLKANLLWPGSHIFIEDPLFGSYAQNIKKIVTATFPNIVPAIDTLKYPNSPLAQLMSLSWGFKETTEEGMDDHLLNWFQLYRH